MFIEVDTLDNQGAENGKIIINLNQIVIMSGDEVVTSNDTHLLLDTQSSYKIRERMFPTKREKSNEPAKELLELFNKLHSLTGGKGKAAFSLTREKKLKDLLTKHRLTEELLLRAATNIGRDAFLQGDNDNNKRYGDVDYLLRPDKAAKWSEEIAEKKKGMF